MEYKHKQTIIKAEQWFPDRPNERVQFTGIRRTYDDGGDGWFGAGGEQFFPTVNGLTAIFNGCVLDKVDDYALKMFDNIEVHPGDWIITDNENKHRLCRKEEFEKLYELI